MSEFDPAGYVTIRPVALSTLFGRPLRYRLTWAQRSYAWREEHVRRLVSDLLVAYRQQPDPRYFLGHVSTAGQPGNGPLAVVDGQQRLITLSLLFAHLRDLLDDGETRASLESCLIFSSATDASGVDAATREPVLELQPNLTSFYAAHILQGADDDRLDPAIESDLSVPERLLLLNRAAIASELIDGGLNGVADVEPFARFLLERCVVALQTVDDEQEALQILATEEETGLPFHESERAKVTLVALMPREEQREAGRIWDVVQARLGNEDLEHLLSHLRVLGSRANWRGRSPTPVETELATQYRCDRDGLGFMRDTLLAASEILETLVSARDGRTLSPRIADWPGLQVSLTFLNWLDQTYWQIAGIAWVRRHGLDHPRTEVVFQGLDRLAWTHRIAASDLPQISATFGQLAAEMAETDDPERWRHFAASKAVRQSALDNLASRTFYYKHFAHLVLRRLSSLMGSDPGPRDNVNVTTEHILPRNPTRGSAWRRDFASKRETANASDRIGNCCFLSFEANQSIGNQDWVVKRPVLAASGLSLAVEAATYEAWNRETIMRRSEKLTSLLREDLGL